MIDTNIQYKELKNTNSTLRWLESGIVHIQWKAETDIEISDIIELEKSFREFTEGNKVCVIQEMGKYSDLNPDARKYVAAHAPDLIGVAYIISGLSQRLVLGFYLKIRIRKSPSKVFSTVEEAAVWLRTL